MAKARRQSDVQFLDARETIARAKAASNQATESQDSPSTRVEPENGPVSGRWRALLVLPVLLLVGTSSKHRPWVVILGLAFFLRLGLRAFLRFRIGSPATKRSVVNNWGKPLGGSAVFRFPIELPGLLDYLEEKKDQTGVKDINITHLAMKAVATALQEMKHLNGHIAFG